jgi:hypothetical protein
MLARLMPYEMPGDLRVEIEESIEYYNCHRYQEGLGHVTRCDVYTGRHLNVMEREKEVKMRTLQARMSCNRPITE